MKEHKADLLMINRTVKSGEPNAFESALKAAKLELDTKNSTSLDIALSIWKNLVKKRYELAYPGALKQVENNVDASNSKVKVAALYLLKALIEAGDKEAVEYAKTFVESAQIGDNKAFNKAILDLKNALAPKPEKQKPTQDPLNLGLVSLQKNITSITASLEKVQSKLTLVKQSLE